MTRKDLKGYETPPNPNRRKGGGRCSKADHGPQVIDKPCPKCGFQWGGGRESGNPGSVGGAESTRAAAANPAAPLDYRWSVSERYLQAQEKRIRELEARVKELEGVYEAEACPSCGKTQVDIWKIHQSVHDPPELRGEDSG